MPFVHCEPGEGRDASNVQVSVPLVQFPWNEAVFVAQAAIG
jgi:hypothetical protein